ncbi:MAG: hypothetical protein EOP07_21330 [Proteobacteria bacterium]|nr:MAG: hypothetical protein EOP07_21330 [Pseudomonadota bacterium]
MAKSVFNLTIAFLVSMSFVTVEGFGYECIAVKGEKNHENMPKPNISIWQIFQISSMRKSLDDAKKSNIEAEAAKAELETYLLDHPAASVELNIIYSKYLNLRVFAVKRRLELLRLIVDSLKDQDREALFKFDRRFQTKTFDTDLDNECDEFARILSLDDKQKFNEIKESNKNTLLDSWSGLKMAYVSAIKEQELSDAKFAEVEENVAKKTKSMIDSWFREVIQIRNAIGQNKTKVYLETINNKFKHDGVFRLF